MSERSSDGHYPNGHFYSPVIDRAEVEAASARIWPAEPDVRGVDFNHEGHRALLREVFPRFIGDYDYPATLPGGADPQAFFDRNPAFGWLDSRALFVLLRHWRPLDGIAGLLPSRVQDVPMATFEALEAGDVLFIDSSHVSKAGSDVNHLLFEVLPRLRAGVHIHFHDIFLPFDYPRAWVLDLGLYWNEQYLIRALLTLSRAFRVSFGSTYASIRCADEVCAALSLAPGSAFGGGSLWIEKLE